VVVLVNGGTSARDRLGRQGNHRGELVGETFGGEASGIQEI
jgi:hypothetical protein